MRRALILVPSFAMVLFAGWLVHYELRGRYFQDTDDAYIEADAVTVSSRVSGYVDRVYVSDNQDVRAGQPLVHIDARGYGAASAQYQAQIDAAKASADDVSGNIRVQQAVVEEARAQLSADISGARFAAGEVARYIPLAASGAETREKLAGLRIQATRASDRANAQRAAVESTQRRIGSLEAQLRQAEASGEVARARLAAADVDLGATVVRASVDGRIGDKAVRVGQYVEPGTRMMSVVPLSAIYVSANYKETQFGSMRRGQPAMIQVDALPGVALRGRVESVAPGTGEVFSLFPPQDTTGNFTKIVQRVPVRVAIEAGPAARRVLVPGLSVTVSVDTFAAKHAARDIHDQKLGESRASRSPSSND